MVPIVEAVVQELFKVNFTQYFIYLFNLIYFV